MRKCALMITRVCTDACRYAAGGNNGDLSFKLAAQGRKVNGSGHNIWGKLLPGSASPSHPTHAPRATAWLAFQCAVARSRWPAGALVWTTMTS